MGLITHGLTPVRVKEHGFVRGGNWRKRDRGSKEVELLARQYLDAILGTGGHRVTRYRGTREVDCAGSSDSGAVTTAAEAGVATGDVGTAVASGGSATRGAGEAPTVGEATIAEAGTTARGATATIVGTGAKVGRAGMTEHAAGGVAGART